MDIERDYEMRLVAIDRVRSLSDRYDDIVPLDVLRKGFDFAGHRISFGSFYTGHFPGAPDARARGAQPHDNATQGNRPPC